MNDFAIVKRALDLRDVIPAESGFEMGKHHLKECPFCNGHHCFSISSDGDFYKCFQCDKYGDVFNFLSAYHGLSANEALQKAAELAGIPLENKRKIIRLDKNEKIFISAARYYHKHLQENGAKDYFLELRGHSVAVLDNMMVGWTDGKLHQHLLGKGYNKQEILESGLIRKDEKKGHLYDFFSLNLAIFPHYYNGRVVHFTIKDPAKKKPSYQLPAAKRHKKWKFYNQDALYRYDELILVEGENDTLSILDAGIRQVIGMTGQISEDQIQALDHHCPRKRLYLWMDNDFDPEKSFVKGYGYVRKIYTRLPKLDIRIIEYPEDYGDPDEYIQALDKKDRQRAIRSLRESAVDYLTWEINRTGQMETLKKRLEHLRELSVFRKISSLPDIEQQIYVEKLEGIGFERKAITQQLEFNSGLRIRIAQYLEDLDSKSDANPNSVAKLIHDYFQNKGRFFHDQENRVYLLYHHHIYEVGNNRPFNALIKRKTGLLPTDQPGRSIWESLASEGFNYGEKIEIGSWLHTDRSKDTIYLNLNSVNNRIVKIAPDGIEEIQNGLNLDNVLLHSSNKIKPFHLLPDVEIGEAVSLLRQLLFDNLSCEREQKFLLICWFISCFLSDFSPHVSPLLKAEGETASGKTTGARLLEYILYGDEHLGEISVAGAYADASQSPLLVIDNLENRDLKTEMMKFLLLVATRGSKVKRKGGTESDITQESPKALVMVTAIEPFVQSELINRTFAVQFSRRYHNPSFIDDEITRQIIKQRDFILSGILKLIQNDILSHLDRRTAYISVLNVQHKRHSKERMNAYLALMILILDKLLRYWDQSVPEAKDIWLSWIFSQDNLAREHEVSSNDILKLLDGLIREYRLRMSEQELKPHYVFGYDEEVCTYRHPEYGLTIIKTRSKSIPDDPELSECIIEFECTSKDLCYAFTRFCKNNNLSNPYPSAAIFGSRLKNDRHLLKKGGWDLVVGKGGKTYYKIIRGQRFLKFRHKLVQ